MTTTSSEIVNVFEKYQKSRVKFVQAVSEYALRPRNIEALQSVGCMDLLRPLLLDSIPSVQQTAALALGRLATHSDDLAEALVTGEILSTLIYALSESNKYNKKSAAFVLRSVSKHSARLAQAVVDCQALEPLVQCLEEFDPEVKEASAWAIAYISKHSSDLAQCVVSEGAIPPLANCLEEPEISLKRVAASALSYIASHSAELAQPVVDSNVMSKLILELGNVDVKMKRQVCSCISNIAKHSIQLADSVVQAGIFPAIFSTLGDQDIIVKKNGATCIREIVKHSPDFAATIINTKGLLHIVEYTNHAIGDHKLPGVMTIGFISAFGEEMATEVVKANAVEVLCSILQEDDPEHVREAAAYALGKIGSHSSEHSRHVGQAGGYSYLLTVYCDHRSGSSLKKQSRTAFKSVIEKCCEISLLEQFLNDSTPKEMLKYVLQQIAKILPGNTEIKKKFVECGGFGRLQKILMESGSPNKESLDIINSNYPEEVVKYYSPNYDRFLLQKIDQEI